MTILDALVRLKADFVKWGNNKLDKNLGDSNAGKFLSVETSGEITAIDAVIPLTKGGTGVIAETPEQARTALKAAPEYWAGTEQAFTEKKNAGTLEEGKLYFIYEE